MKLGWFLPAIAILGLLGGTSVSAAIVKLSYTGADENINDATGVFGAPGRISGVAFVETFVIDTSKGVFSDSSTPGDISQFLHGGPDQFFPSTSPISASLTINGHTLSVIGRSGSISLANASAFNYFDDNALVQDQFTAGGDSIDNIISADLYIRNPALVVGLPTSLSSPFALAIDGSNVVAYASYSNVVIDATGNVVVNSLGSLDATRVTLTAVPEPAVWTMMIAGFGGVGGGLRRRRVATA